MTRATKFTLPAAERALKAHALGQPVKYCAAAAGVGRRTLQDWLERGQTLLDELEEPGELEALKGAVVAGDRDRGCLWFALAWAQAEGRFVARQRRKILKDADGSHGAQWWLQRYAPHDFHEKRAVELSGPEGGPLALSINLDDLLTRLDRLDPLRDPSGGRSPPGAPGQPPPDGAA